MNYRYLVIKEEWMEKGVNLTRYGIAVAAVYEECCIILESYTDVSGDNESVSELVRKCNDLQLDPIHFSEVVEDFIGDYETDI